MKPEAHKEPRYRMAVLNDMGIIVMMSPLLSMSAACKLACELEVFGEYEIVVFPPTHDECQPKRRHGSAGQAEAA